MGSKEELIMKMIKELMEEKGNIGGDIKLGNFIIKNDTA